MGFAFLGCSLGHAPRLSGPNSGNSSSDNPWPTVCASWALQATAGAGAGNALACGGRILGTKAICSLSDLLVGLYFHGFSYGPCSGGLTAILLDLFDMD